MWLMWLMLREGRRSHCLYRSGRGMHQLSLPRKPRKKMLASFSHWVRCFCIYGNSLTASQPSRGPDLLGYLYLMASMEQEFTFPACLSYDIAFRRKTHKFHLATWGHIDTQLYARAFTGPGKAKPQACCDLCLASTHSTTQCPFYSGGPVKKARASTSGPKIPTTPPIFHYRSLPQLQPGKVYPH